MKIYIRDEGWRGSITIVAPNDAAAFDIFVKQSEMSALKPYITIDNFIDYFEIHDIEEGETFLFESSGDR